MPAVHGDRDRLVQVLTNLLSNAIKYSSGGAIQVASRVHGADVEVSVRDHGVGVPAALIEKIFERYARAAYRPVMSMPGTGLGLAISRQIVTMHGGRIWAESEPGRGSVFRFQIPIGGPPEAGKENAGP
jgi:two-component system phosphate regulon sensor histidine kinase PhoR